MKRPSEETIRSIYYHCNSVYPEEACGFIFSNGTVHMGKNIQNQLHKQKPDIYTRTAKTGYTLSVSDMKTLQESFKSNNPVTVIYHSHPDVGAYFSEEDTRQALLYGEPIYPVMYLVVDTQKYLSRSAKLFAFKSGLFECIAEFDAFGKSIDVKKTETV
ncbi:Mov34/MPN/PAD-1 family protein [Parendozoicomonas sp. Alg238-R29]|uniref:Mov34/MPN/PAD-1 family protein n=1 Tax=Parendozoicomonas sp. Alg238-R29 TaxID=2993446 RepID=UPI00248E1C97|nr:Mov34/MPN/PAD-1 family protein [Parendozoicomonas sp. Alg238-R29]